MTERIPGDVSEYRKGSCKTMSFVIMFIAWQLTGKCVTDRLTWACSDMRLIDLEPGPLPKG
ncbi:hypothetical protein M514_16094 [Trichuris suis]|uniref:Uncharacterized protein n=1 Tax=Trichuris suis TaxID=68888 RepID=A0A085NQ28_9BILA|nr:hypothetical protein M514_16094 [Trichuris suis]